MRGSGKWSLPFFRAVVGVWFLAELIGSAVGDQARCNPGKNVIRFCQVTN
jgi:hypothetical protein